MLIVKTHIVDAINPITISDIKGSFPLTPFRDNSIEAPVAPAIIDVVVIGNIVSFPNTSGDNMLIPKNGISIRYPLETTSIDSLKSNFFENNLVLKIDTPCSPTPNIKQNKTNVIIPVIVLFSIAKSTLYTKKQMLIMVKYNLPKI